MDVARLKTLIHVAELGSLSKAADRLGIAQPALSRQIRLLEAEIGAPLFVRHGRGMAITPIGRQALDHATRAMAELDAMRGVAARVKGSLTGDIRIGVTPTVAEIVAVPLVRALAPAHPALKLRLTAAYSGYLLDWLRRDELDLAVSYDPPPTRSLRIAPVMVEELLLVRAGAARRARPAIPFARLKGERLILPSARHGLRLIMESCAQRADIALDAAIEADSFGAMIDLVRAGFGATVLPLAPIHALTQSGALNATRLKDPTPERKLVLAFPADRPIRPAQRIVGETLVAVCRDLVERKIWTGRALGAAHRGEEGRVRER